MSSFSCIALNGDLRLHDNPALFYAAQNNDHPLVVLYITPERCASARAWWIKNSLNTLGSRLHGQGIPLFVCSPQNSAHALGLITDILKKSDPTMAIQTLYSNQDMPQLTIHHSVLHHVFYPNILCVGNDFQPLDKAYKVFTPYWKQIQKKIFPLPLGSPSFLPHHAWNKALTPYDGPCWLDEDKAFSSHSWHHKLAMHWEIGEQAALKKWDAFFYNRLKTYHATRNSPGILGTSILSPHLCAGEISIRKLWYDSHNALGTDDFCGTREGIDSFLSELGWREFFYYTLEENPDLMHTPLKKEYVDFFDILNKKSKKNYGIAWENGMTGYPLVDAGMRQLWQTGWMHNRVRMVVASFAIKNLFMDWRQGESWFFDTLVDADHASNAGNWQWVAGCGTDSSPYFRIFNPVLQSKTHDPEGDYLRRWIPEIAHLGPESIHEPWLYAPHYPKPIVDFASSRSQSLALHKAFSERMKAC